ncbi:vacuolar protein-sorting-associated protein 33 homolog isoform X3 [Cucumis melo]|uniref:Vacuolar protein-sorting-associated protein 33 homolog isoform X2 n=1 Tax=Cucumis melo TaxID=3656 RepID=A0ABM3KTR3_CUCME|nr:vacuolar protein-sorting-associated protein 33 homolog isoform X2 [Cucumis melo]XP_050941180.1 vacuolar protein-sorting-associated protein 33 homolog isoform X3 [Cucumis melo]
MINLGSWRPSNTPMEKSHLVLKVDMVTPMCSQLTYEGLFDEVDMVTPMCSQLTYEGLFDEFLHVSNGSVELDSSIMGAQQDGKKIKVPLNSS